jgi:hypothetical protein
VTQLVAPLSPMQQSSDTLEAGLSVGIPIDGSVLVATSPRTPASAIPSRTWPGRRPRLVPTLPSGGSNHTEINDQLLGRYDLTGAMLRLG